MLTCFGVCECDCTPLIDKFVKADFSCIPPKGFFPAGSPIENKVLYLSPVRYSSLIIWNQV